MGVATAVNGVQVIAADGRARLKAQGVNTAAIAQPIHHVVHVVVLDDVLFARRRLRIPLPADGNATVWQLMDQVVRKHRLLGETDPDADRAVELDSATVYVVVADAVALGNIRFRRGPAQHDAVAADIENVIALDKIVDATAYELDSAAAQVRQHAVFQAALLGEVPANRSGHARPNRPSSLCLP